MRLLECHPKQKKSMPIRGLQYAPNRILACRADRLQVTNLTTNITACLRNFRLFKALLPPPPHVPFGTAYLIPRNTLSERDPGTGMFKGFAKSRSKVVMWIPSWPHARSAKSRTLKSPNIGALPITYTIFGVPYYNDSNNSITYPQSLILSLKAPSVNHGAYFFPRLSKPQPSKLSTKTV